jgi:hypothetical protein
MTTSSKSPQDFEWVSEMVVQPRPAAPIRAHSVINWYLIALGLLYVIWSWVHLPSSIWARSLLACYLIWRMKPDVVIPFMLTGIQLRLQFNQADDFGNMQAMSEQLTGFEQYAFMVPCILYAIRTFVAALSARAARRAEFPFGLYLLYLFGMLFVLVGAVSAIGTGGWTAGLRTYCLVGLYFYGLLLPACSQRQMTQLAVAFAIVGMAVLTAANTVGFRSRQLWVLLPFAGSFAPILVLRAARPMHVLLAAWYALAGFTFAFNATFTVQLLWLWNTVAGICLGPSRRQSLRATMVVALTYSLFVFSLGLLFYGALAHDPTREAMESSRAGSLFDRINYKLCGDRGPIWWGAMLELAEHPTLCGIPSPFYTVQSHGKEGIWKLSTHNIVLDPLLRLGIVAGPILLLVLVHAVLVAKNAIMNESSIGVVVIALAVISNIVLGGATLPYMLSDREAEHMLMAAGLLGVYGIGKRGVRERSSPAPDRSAPDHLARPAA